jgi:putative nucleotidyltransferase with HDIG domain
MTDRLRLADLLAALSVTTDLAMGQTPGKSIRACVVATEVARHMGLSEADVADVYFTTLLKHLGCTATSHEEAAAFGPGDLEARPLAERTDETVPREAVALLLTAGRGTGLARPAYVARAVVRGRAASAGIFRAICEVATMMAARLELGEGVERALAEGLERWDGKGAPRGLRGDEVAIATRIAEPATQAVIFHELGGPDAVAEIARRRSGGMFDPAVVASLRAVGPAVLERLDRDDPWEAVLAAEPAPVRHVPEARLEAVAAAFGDMVDLKTTYTLGHSAGVAELAAAAAERVGLADPRALRVAALLHDLGRAGVGAGVWEKPGALHAAEWERVRLHPYHTERILERSEALAPLARIAGMHHERLDGSGYHRGASAADTPAEARLLAAADAYQAITQDRPHRPARPPAEAAELVEADVRAGRFDPECAKAVLEVAGARPPRSRTAWPAGLTDREVEVLGLVSRGLSNRAIAEALTISPRTAEHHVQHVYGKIGVSTRAAAALFAMEHGLLRP